MSFNKSIIENIYVSNKLDEQTKRNINILYVFRDESKEINAILVTNDDKFYCFGNNSHGVLGFGHHENIADFTINEYMSNKLIIDMKNSFYHIIVRDKVGKVYCWGTNRYLGNGREDENISKPQLNKYLINLNIIDICCGHEHTLVLTSNNEVYAWGGNKYGQIGNTNKSNIVSIPFKLDQFNNERVKAISCGYYHSMVLTESGCVYSWGYNSCGQVGLNNRYWDENKPKRIQIEYKIKQICCGQYHSVLLSIEGLIFVFGSNEFNQLGLETDGKKQLIPIKLNHSEKFVKIASHYDYNISAALSENNLHYIWGKCGRVEGNIREPKKTQFNSFDEIFVHYFQINHKCAHVGSHQNMNKRMIEKKRMKVLEKETKHKDLSLITTNTSSTCKIYLMGKNSETKAYENETHSKLSFTTKNNIGNKTINIVERKEKISNFTQKLSTFSLKNPGDKVEKILTKSQLSYTGKELIGKGSFGKVYKVFHQIEQQYYAMKEIDLKNFPEETKEKFLKEIKIMAKLKSNYVIDHKTSWIEDNCNLYFVMELCYNTLREVLLQKQNEFKRKKFEAMNPIEFYISSELFKEILEGINYLHKLNPPIIHRDLKPTNILISFGTNLRFVKIADFGLATNHKYDDQSHTAGLGTLRYVAPEVQSGRSYDLKADIYSLGFITQELFSIDIFASTYNPIDNLLLKDKYNTIFDYILKMMETRSLKRPDCQQILNSKSLWYLDLNAIRSEIAQQKINEFSLTDQSIEKSFHKFFIKTKLMNR